MRNNDPKRTKSIKIPYDREELEEIINLFLNDPQYAREKEEVFIYVHTLEKEIAKISRYQAISKPENVYYSMNTSLLEIRKIADAIHKLTKHCHPNLPTELKQLILRWIQPLEEALKEPLLSDDEAAFKTKWLYAEQSFVSRRDNLQEKLIQHLEELKALLLIRGVPAPRCYFSYAWPSKKKKEKEYWVQPFLYILRRHLKTAGIQVIMDTQDNKPGNSIAAFTKHYGDGDYIILIGTESLREKHHAEDVHVIQTELNIIASRFKQDQEQYGQSRIYPLLISGTLETAYPEWYRGYSTVRDAREDGYLKTLKNLTNWIYDFRLKSSIKKDYVDLWQKYFDSVPNFPNNIQAIEQEIAMNYHRRSIKELKQNRKIQASCEEHASSSSSSLTTKKEKSDIALPPIIFMLDEQKIMQQVATKNDKSRLTAMNPRTSISSSHNKLWPQTGAAPTSGFQTLNTQPPINISIGDVSITSIGENATVSQSSVVTSVSLVNLQLPDAQLTSTIIVGDHLPYEVHGYIRRQILLASIQDKLEKQQSAIRKLAIVGVTGAGKTELAVAFARNYIHSQSGSSPGSSSSSNQISASSEGSKPILAYFIDARTKYYLASFEALADSLSINVNVLRERYKPDATAENKNLYEEQLVIKLNQALRHYDYWMLIYDNVQSLEDVRRLTPRAQGLRGAIVYTSQDTTLLDKESRIEVSGMTEEEAAALFEHFTGLQDKEGALALAESLDSLPLAIQVAGRYIKYKREEAAVDMGYGAYQDLHRTTLQSLDAAQAAICRQQDIPQTQYAAIKLSVDSLSPAGRQLLTFLGLFERKALPEAFLCEYTKTYLGQKHNVIGIETDVAINVLRQHGLLNRDSALHKTWFLHQVTHDYVNYFCIDLPTQVTPENLQLLQHGAAILQSKAIMQINQQIYKHALFFFDRIITIAHEHLPAPLQCDIASGLYEWGAFARSLGNNYTARSWLEHARNIQELYDPHSPALCRTFNVLGLTYADLGDKNEQIKMHTCSLKLRESIYGEMDPLVTIALSSLAQAYAFAGDPAKAIALSERALTILNTDDETQRALITDSFKTAQYEAGLRSEILFAKGYASSDMGDAIQAKALLEEAIEQKKKAHANGHYLIAIFTVSLVKVYLDLGRANEAKKLIDDALAISEAHYGIEHHEPAHVRMWQGIVAGELGNVQYQKELLEQALNVKRDYYGESYYEVWQALIYLSRTYGLVEAATAKNWLLQALKIYKGHYGESHVELAFVLINLGRVCLDLNEMDVAAGYLDDARSILVAHQNRNKPWFIEMLLYQAEAAKRHQNLPAATTLCRNALNEAETYYQDARPALLGRIHLTLAHVLHDSLQDAEAKTEAKQAVAIFKALSFSIDHPWLKEAEAQAALDSCGDTYLDPAVASEQDGVAGLLIGRGDDIYATNHARQTPFGASALTAAEQKESSRLFLSSPSSQGHTLMAEGSSAVNSHLEQHASVISAPNAMAPIIYVKKQIIHNHSHPAGNTRTDVQSVDGALPAVGTNLSSIMNPMPLMPTTSASMPIQVGPHQIYRSSKLPQLSRAGEITPPAKTPMARTFVDAPHNTLFFSATKETMMAYPTDGQYALMAKLVYLDKGAQDCEHPFTTMGAQHGEDLDAHYGAWRDRGWARWDFYEDVVTGYVGAVYVNHHTRQVVLAHRGTVPSVLSSLKEDYQAILMGQLGDQQRVAFNYYRNVLSNFRGEGKDNVINNKRLSSYQLSFTGHSLGAWLSEVCAADCLLNLGMVIHTVTFESPGARPMIVDMAHDEPVKVQHLLKTLDIISYLAAPNLINVCNPHVGALRRLKTAFPPMSGLAEWFIYTLNMHGMSELLLTFNHETGLPHPFKCGSVQDWPHYNLIHHASQEYKVFHELVSQDTEYSQAGGTDYDEYFRMTYGAHYQFTLFQSDRMDVRHIHPLVRDFITGYRDVSASLTPKLIALDARFEPLLGRYQLITQDGEQILVIQPLEGQSSMSATAWSSEITALLANHPAVFTQLTEALQFDSRIEAIEYTRERLPALMTLIERGAVLEYSTYEDNPMTFAELGPDTTSEQLVMVQRTWDKMPEEKKRMVGVEAGAKLSHSHVRNNPMCLFKFGTTGSSSSIPRSVSSSSSSSSSSLPNSSSSSGSVTNSGSSNPNLSGALFNQTPSTRPSSLSSVPESDSQPSFSSSPSWLPGMAGSDLAPPSEVQSKGLSLNIAATLQAMAEGSCVEGNARVGTTQSIMSIDKVEHLAVVATAPSLAAVQSAKDYRIDVTKKIAGQVKEAGLEVANVSGLPHDKDYFAHATKHTQTMIDQGIRHNVEVTETGRVGNLKDSIGNIAFSPSSSQSVIQENRVDQSIILAQWDLFSPRDKAINMRDFLIKTNQYYESLEDDEHIIAMKEELKQLLVIYSKNVKEVTKARRDEIRDKIQKIDEVKAAICKPK